jgi:hypothetical protein
MPLTYSSHKLFATRKLHFILSDNDRGETNQNNHKEHVNGSMKCSNPEVRTCTGCSPYRAAVRGETGIRFVMRLHSRDSHEPEKD